MVTEACHCEDAYLVPDFLKIVSLVDFPWESRHVLRSKIGHGTSLTFLV